SDLVQEDRSAVSESEFATPRCRRSGKRTTYMAKELRFEQRVGDRRAIDFDARPVVLSAETVNGARDQLFATSGLAGNQYRASARRNELDLPSHRRDVAAHADHCVVVA